MAAFASGGGGGGGSGVPPAKKRRPEVPLFAPLEALSPGEYERRLKSGKLDANTPPPGAVPAQPARPPQPPQPTPGPLAGAAPSVQATGGASSGGANASQPPAAEPSHEEPAAPGAEKQPKVGWKHAGVYGFDVGKSQGSARKAIALRLEPLKSGLPALERVLSEDRQTVTIGSKRGAADLVIVDEAVSKKHCVLALIGIKGELALAITDLSTNGTFVNGQRLPAKNKRFRIRSGDRVEVKNTVLDDDFGWKCEFGNTVSFFTRA